MGIYWREGWAWAKKEINGHTYRKPLRTRAKREAEAAYARWLVELEDELSSASPGKRKAVSFADAIDNFTEHHFPNLKPSTRIRYMQSLINLTPHFGSKSLQEIGKVEIGEFVSDRRKTGSRRKGRIADSSIIRDLQCLAGVFTIANDFDLVDGNPAAVYIKAHQRRKTLVNSPPRERYLSHDEEKRVLDAALARALDPKSIRRHEKAMIAAAFALYVDLGLRAQELLKAQRSWINLSKNEITVPGKFSKSGKPRTIPLFPRARRIIEALPINKHSDLLLWRTIGGRGFADLNKSFQAIAASVGVHGVEIHDLRRTCGCRLLQDHRMRMAEVSAWLGHASTEQTETTYAFLEVENLHDATGGRVIEKAARLYLAEWFQMQFHEITGTMPYTIETKLIEKKG